MAKEIFPGPLGEIIQGITSAVETVDGKYQSLLADSVLRKELVERRNRFSGDKLGRFYRRWYNCPRPDNYGGGEAGNNAWREFVAEYGSTRPNSRDSQVTLSPGVFYCELPRIPAYKGSGEYNMAAVRANAELQLAFTRALGVLGEEEDWSDFMSRPQDQLAEDCTYKKAAVLLSKSPKVLICKTNEEMVEYPFVLSDKYPGVSVHFRLFPVEAGSEKTTPQLIAENKVWVVTSMRGSADLLFEETVNCLQTPAGKGRFLKDLSRLFSKSG